MDRTNSPENTWFRCHRYICDVDNCLAHPALNYEIPNHVAGGDREDISHILCFHWFQPVLALDIKAKHPDTREEPGFFVGFAHNIGDALTFKILLTDMKTVVVRSVVRPANYQTRRNKRVTFNDDLDKTLCKYDPPIPDTHKGFWKKNHDEEAITEEIPVAGRTRSHQQMNLVNYYVQ